MRHFDHYLLLGSRHDRLSEPSWFETDEDWLAKCWSVAVCAGQAIDEGSCSRLRRGWFESDEKLEVIVSSVGRGFARTRSNPALDLMREDAVDLFGPYLEGVKWAPVSLRTRNRLEPTGYFMRLVPREVEVEFGRGKRTLRPTVCPVCSGTDTYTPARREMGILRWQARGRPVLADPTNWLAVLPEFFSDMKLKERFPDIKVVHKIKIYDKDPRGWVLPGDPEWDGELRTPKGWIDPRPAAPLFDTEEEFQAFLRQCEEEDRANNANP